MWSQINCLNQRFGGFNYNNLERNVTMLRAGYKPPEIRRTGTTIAGFKFQGGVILGADTRSCFASEIAQIDCQKIYQISENIFCCGAGSAADIDNVALTVRAYEKILRMNLERDFPVSVIKEYMKQLIFRHRGVLECCFLMGGVDKLGKCEYFTIYPYGSNDSAPYSALGSGGEFAISVLELHYRWDLTEKEAFDLMNRAILAGIENDNMSGDNVDIAIVRNSGVSDLYVHYTSITTPFHIKPRKLYFSRGFTKKIKEEIVDEEIF